MKLQRSRFRLISLVLFFSFLFVVLLCLRNIGLFQTDILNGSVEGESPLAEESLTQTENGSESIPETSVPANDFDTYGL